MTHNEILAEKFTAYIEKLGNDPERLDNFKSYLSHHFDIWFKKYANTPENLCYELQTFAEM